MFQEMKIIADKFPGKFLQRRGASKLRRRSVWRWGSGLCGTEADPSSFSSLSWCYIRLPVECFPFVLFAPKKSMFAYFVFFAVKLPLLPVAIRASSLFSHYGLGISHSTQVPIGVYSREFALTILFPGNMTISRLYGKPYPMNVDYIAGSCHLPSPPPRRGGLLFLNTCPRVPLRCTRGCLPASLRDAYPTIQLFNNPTVRSLRELTRINANLHLLKRNSKNLGRKLKRIDAY